MRLRLRLYFEHLRSNTWFVPLLMAVGGALLALAMLALDRAAPAARLLAAQGFWLPSVEGGRVLLAWLLSTTLATVGIVFALLTVPMSVATSQFGSRLLRGYQRDRTTQFVLGLFVATPVYCAVALILMPAEDAAQALPLLTITVALLLGVATFGGVIALISHIGIILQAPRLIFRAAEELRRTIRDELDPAGKELDAPAVKQLFAKQAERVLREGWPVHARATGYVHAVNTEAILALAQRHDLIVFALHRPGRFVAEGAVVAMVWPPGRAAEEVVARVRAAFLQGEARTVPQDLEYGVSQLVEIACRALSPAINDPYTAITCLHQLGASLALAAERARPTPYHSDAGGNLRYVYQPPTFADLADAAYHLIRRYARECPDVLLALLDSLALAAAGARREDDRAVLLAHAKLVLEEAEASEAIAAERLRIGAHYAAVHARIVRQAAQVTRWQDYWAAG